MTVTQIALRHFQQRQRHAQARSDDGIWAREEAEARLRPWAAAAIRCWADPALVHPDLPAAIASRMAAGDSEPLARAMVADELCSVETMRAELARTLDEAIRNGHKSAADLATLAIWLSCPPHVPADLQEEFAA